MGVIRFFSGGSKSKSSGRGIKKVTGSIINKGEIDYSYLQPLEPHPEVFEVLECSEGTNFLYVVVKYPHCINFEGVKVLVMEDTSKTDVLLMKTLDPHFYEDNKIVARFKPDEEGKRLAKILAGVLNCENSWKLNPDKSGGAFTNQEISETGWK